MVLHRHIINAFRLFESVKRQKGLFLALGYKIYKAFAIFWNAVSVSHINNLER